MPAADLLVPATARLLEGWTGPVVWEGRRAVVDHGEAFLPDSSGGGEWWPLAWSDATVARGEHRDGRLLSLDLADDAAADRAARVLAEAVCGQPVPGSGYSFWFDGGYPSAEHTWRLSRPNSPCAVFVAPGQRRPFVPLHGVLVEVSAPLPEDERAALAAVGREVLRG